MKCPHCRVEIHDVSSMSAVPANNHAVGMEGGRPTWWRVSHMFCPNPECTKAILRLQKTDAKGVVAEEWMVYPQRSATGPDPSPDMPPEIRLDFEEARRIADASPRGAAALLRLCVQKLCEALGEPGRNINDDIAKLVSKGVDPVVQEALDSVRVIGNEAVHPGQMDLRDDRQTVDELFDAINFIVDQTLTRKNKIKALYDKLPLDKRRAIDERNAKAVPPDA